MSFAFEIERLRKVQDAYVASGCSDPEFPLAPSVNRQLASAIDEIPVFTRLADAGKLVVKTIHGIVDLYHDINHGDFEFYLGRCGATSQHLYNRFESHFTNPDRYHQAGVAVLRCSNSVVTTWEGAAIRALSGLKKRQRLCVANVLCHGGGGMPKMIDESAIYLTWKVLPRTAPVTLAVRRDIEGIAIEVSEAMGGDVSRDSMIRALDPITRPIRDRAEVNWAPGHLR